MTADASARRRPRRAAALPILAGAGLLALVGCSASDSTADAPAAESADVVQEARDALPESIRESGVITAASSFDYGPFAFVDAGSGETDGYDYDTVNAIAERLGVEVEWTQLGSFESLIPAAQSGQADVVVDGMGILEERLPAVSFVYNAKADVAVLVRAGNPDGVDPADLCGSRLTTAPSGLQALVFQDESDECVAAGEDPIDISLMSDTAAASAAVLSGQTSGQGWGSASGAFTVAQNPDFEITEPVPGYATPDGIIVQNSERGTALGEAFALALNAMIEDGTLQSIGDDHGFADSAIPTESMFVGTPDQLDTLLASDPALANGQG